MMENSFAVFNKSIQDKAAFEEPAQLLQVLMWLNHVVSLNNEAYDSLPATSTAPDKKDIRSISVEQVSDHEVESRQKIRTILDEQQDDAVAIEALKLVAKLKDTEALSLVLKFLADYERELDLQEQALNTLFAIDPNLENEESKKAILAFMKESHISGYIKPFLVDQAYPDRFLWLKEFVEAEYQDSHRDLELSDLEFLKVTSTLKPNIADFSDQLTEVFMFNQHDYDYKHAAIDVLNLYFPDSGPIKKSVMDEYKSILEISPTSIQKSLIRKIENYTGDVKFPQWNSTNQLNSGSIKLVKNSSVLSLCQIADSTMHYDENSRPKSFENKELDLKVDYFYDENGSLAATKVKHQAKDYPFVVRKDEQQHEHMGLYDYPDLKYSRKYPSMQLLASEEDAEKLFLHHDPQKLTIFGDGRIQIKDEDKFILLATDGSLLVSENSHQGIKEFVSAKGEYNYLEPVFG